MNDSSASVRPRSSFPRWHEWLAGGLLLLVAFGYFVVRPATERLLQGLGGLAAAIATQTFESLSQTHALACLAIELDPSVQHLLGGEITCAPVDGVTWRQPRDGETLEFEFSVTSDSGKKGTALVVARLHQDGPEIESIVVNGDEGSVLLLQLP